jgi:hypothetical protein
VSDCPTNATVRPLLLRRRTEDKAAVARLTPDQFDDLRSEKVARANRAAAERASQPARRDDAPCLFDLSTRGGA